MGLKRAMTRNLAEGINVEEGRFEAEAIEFHNRVREGYLTWAALHHDRIKTVDASPGPELVFAGVRSLVEEALAGS